MVTTGTSSRPTQVVAIRHGETVWNQQGRFQGQRDSPLTPLGCAQADALAARLAGERFAGAVTSDLERSVATCRRLLVHHPDVPMHLEPRFRERDFGVLSGLTRAEALARDPAFEAAYRTHDPAARAPGGESSRELQARAMEALEAWGRTFAGQRWLLVAHGGVLGVIFRAVLGIPLTVPRAYRVPNTAYNTFEQAAPGEPWTLTCWADNTHLKTLKATDDPS